MTDIPAKLSRAEAEERLRRLPRLTDAHIRAVLDRCREPHDDTPLEALSEGHRETARQVRAITAAHAAYLKG